MIESKFKCVWKDSTGCMYESVFKIECMDEKPRDLLFREVLIKANRFLVECILIPGEPVPELVSIAFVE